MRSWCIKLGVSKEEVISVLLCNSPSAIPRYYPIILNIRKREPDPVQRPSYDPEGNILSRCIPHGLAIYDPMNITFTHDYPRLFLLSKNNRDKTSEDNARSLVMSILFPTSFPSRVICERISRDKN